VHEAIAGVVQALTATCCSLDASDAELLRSYIQMIADRKARPSGIDLSESAGEGEVGTDQADQVLRPRHRETLEWLLTGATEKEIAAGLGLSVHTVHQYVKAIYRRFGVTSRAQLMASRLRNGTTTTTHSC
jgi:DNA-binding CsgD family transcriptional regulator